MLEKTSKVNSKLGMALALTAISIPTINQVASNVHFNNLTAHADTTNQSQSTYSQTVYVNVVNQNNGQVINQDVLTLTPNTMGTEATVKDTKGVFNGSVPENNGNIDLSSLLHSSKSGSASYNAFIFGQGSDGNRQYIIPGTQNDGKQTTEQAQVSKDSKGNIVLTFNVVPNPNYGKGSTASAAPASNASSTAPTSTATTSTASSAASSHIVVSGANTTPLSDSTSNGSDAPDATISPDGQTGKDVANQINNTSTSNAVPNSSASSATSASNTQSGTASSAAPTSDTPSGAVSSATSASDAQSGTANSTTSTSDAQSGTASSATQASDTQSGTASSATPTSDTQSGAASSAAPTSNAQSGITDNSPNTIKEGSSDSNIGQSNANTDKSDANLEYGHGIDPLTGKALKDESPAQQQKAKEYVNKLNNGETATQAKKELGIADTGNNDGTKNGTSSSTTTKSNTPVGDSNDGMSSSSTTSSNSPVGDTTSTTTTTNGLAQTADANKTSVGAVLGIGAVSIMSMLGLAGVSRKRTF